MSGGTPDGSICREYPSVKPSAPSWCGGGNFSLLLFAFACVIMRLLCFKIQQFISLINPSVQLVYDLDELSKVINIYVDISLYFGIGFRSWNSPNTCACFLRSISLGFTSCFQSAESCSTKSPNIINKASSQKNNKKQTYIEQKQKQKSRHSYLRASSSRLLASISLLGGYFGRSEGSQAKGSIMKNCIAMDKVGKAYKKYGKTPIIDSSHRK